MNIKITAEWFPIVLGTMVLSLISWENSVIWNNLYFFDIGKIIYYIGLFLFIIFLILFSYSYLSNPPMIKEDFNKINRVAFTAFIGVLLFVFGFFTTVYIKSSPLMINFLYYVYIFAFLFVLSINIIVSYKLFSQSIKQEELNYSVLVPSIALSANVILGAPILPPYFSYLTKEEAEIAYFIMLFSVGITFFQFIFIGTAAFLSHVYTKSYQTSPAIMIPLGASSIIAINLLTFPSYNYLNLFYFPTKFAITISIILWGFEVWNFIVAAILAIKNVRMKMPLTVWAYVFPVGIASFADFMLYEETKIAIFFVSIDILSIAIILFYIYAMYNTINTIRSLKSS
ncbi:hypothetical protein [Acidianus manzaensis]|nr:hypothetical protein [Acidianus manzaensis]